MKKDGNCEGTELLEMMKKQEEHDMEVKQELREFFGQEDGVGVIELVLVLVVLIGLVIVFKEQINKLLENIFKEINSQSKEVY